VAIHGNLYIGDGPSVEDYVGEQFNVNTDNFSWKFDKDYGMMMWSGA
jgi:hypothetical protein